MSNKCFQLVAENYTKTINIQKEMFGKKEI